MEVHLMVVAMLRASAVVLTLCSGGTVGSLQPTVQHLQRAVQWEGEGQRVMLEEIQFSQLTGLSYLAVVSFLADTRMLA